MKIRVYTKNIHVNNLIFFLTSITDTEIIFVVVVISISAKALPEKTAFLTTFPFGNSTAPVTNPASNLADRPGAIDFPV